MFDWFVYYERSKFVVRSTSASRKKQTNKLDVSHTVILPPYKVSERFLA